MYFFFILPRCLGKNICLISMLYSFSFFLCFFLPSRSGKKKMISGLFSFSFFLSTIFFFYIYIFSRFRSKKTCLISMLCPSPFFLCSFFLVLSRRWGRDQHDLGSGCPPPWRVPVVFCQEGRGAKGKPGSLSFYFSFLCNSSSQISYLPHLVFSCSAPTLERKGEKKPRSNRTVWSFILTLPPLSARQPQIYNSKKC